MTTFRNISFTINGEDRTVQVPGRMLLSDFLRAQLRLTGTHVGCEQGVCGSCTVQIDGQPVRSCLMLAVQIDGRSVRTIEALADTQTGALHPLQEAFHACHALQCGFCTPGFLMTLEPALPSLADATDEQIREVISGNLCRCTGYQGIVEAVRSAVGTEHGSLRQAEAGGTAEAEVNSTSD